MTHDDTEDSGLEAEKWMFRLLLGGALVALGAAVLGSLDDIKRYVRIRNM